ncbi:NADH-quinone oxidoreductase subunit NuoF [bacterium]|nr:NADH-quinone oxidoreductase subunit NuoF [bacterium]
MYEDYQKILTRYVNDPSQPHIDGYERNGGYQAWKKAATEMTPEQITEEVKKSSLRGRGGAGFPTGQKWSFVPKNIGKPTYLCCNADESEPLTFKDRVIIEKDPHQLIEGICIASYAIGCEQAFIYIRGEFAYGAQQLDIAIRQARAKKYLGSNLFGKGINLNITVFRGAGAYICGEETGLMESLEGKRGQPRIKPPFPAVAGLYGCPTVINNVETLANLPHIINRGSEWYTTLGPKNNHGPKLFCLSGFVKKPGIYEYPMGMPLREMIEKAGGVSSGRSIKGVIPGGSSVPVLPPSLLDTAMDFDSVSKAGSMLGSAGVMVIDDSVCIVRLAMVTARFYAHETCGQCSQCREGTHWLYQILHRIEEGEGRMQDLDVLVSASENMMGRTICVLSDAAAMPTLAFLKHFRSEFEDHITQKRCTIPRQRVLTPEVAIAGD